MFDFFAQFTEPKFLIMVLSALAAFATVASIAMAALTGDRLGARLKYVSSEREAMRAERLAELADSENRQARLRNNPKGFMKQIVEQLNLSKLLETDATRERLKMAGMRGQAPVVAFLFFRLILPFVTFGGALFYVYVLRQDELPMLMKIGISMGAAFFGFYLPNIFITNLIHRRQQSIKRAFPDSLDLLLICVQAGMSVEAAFNKVATEIGARSLELAEEFSLTTAELSYLPDRCKAYENLGKRTGLPGVKAVGTALVQAERYGTSIGTALRTMAQENRDMRMAEAEKKAASLPPKLTVPMIVFFLPVLFIVILGPAYIKVMEVRGG
jgi:tight adherence protein C